MAKKEYIEREKYVKLNDIIETLEHEWGYEGMREDLYNLPTADVVKIIHGEWKEGHYEGGLLDGVNFDKCNICGYERLIEDVKYKTTYKYCPNCGAKMDRKGD